MLEEIVLEKLLGEALDYAKKVLRGSETKLTATRDEIEESISRHLSAVNKWSSEVSFYGLKNAKDTSDVFIELDLFVYPRRVRADVQENIESLPLKNIFDQGGHVILLGQPGAGKTTSMKYLCQLLFHDPDFHAERFAFPILIKLRELNGLSKNSKSIIFDQISNILGLNVVPIQKLLDNLPPSVIFKIVEQLRIAKENLAISFLNNCNVLLILDGFDELTQGKLREDVIRDIRNLSEHLDAATFILTSRSGDFIYSIHDTAQYELRSLDEPQIAVFALKWLKDENSAKDFLARVYASPFADTAIRPLTLAHLCAIYERIGKIPDKPKSIYRRIVNLLLEEWDKERSVRRESRYAKFETDRKFEFLCHLAYSLTVSLQKTVFSKEDLLRAYNEIYQDYGLEKNEAQQVVNELETHTGLFLQTGVEIFEFAHKSIQEYLTAEHIVKLPSLPERSTTFRLPNELAIAVAISSRPSDYLSELVFSRFQGTHPPKNFTKSFLHRLLLEKPDFNSSIKVGLSLILLYSFYLKASMDYERRTTVRTHAFNDEFESLMRAVIQKAAIDIILRGYEKTEEIYMKDGDAIYQMNKRVGSSDKLMESLPGAIHIRSSMLKMTSIS